MPILEAEEDTKLLGVEGRGEGLKEAKRIQERNRELSLRQLVRKQSKKERELIKHKEEGMLKTADEPSSMKRERRPLNLARSKLLVTLV